MHSFVAIQPLIQTIPPSVNFKRVDCNKAKPSIRQANEISHENHTQGIKVHPNEP